MIIQKHHFTPPFRVEKPKVNDLTLVIMFV